MLLRARFFDDWRLSRIDEEVERLSVNSDTSVAVDTTSASLCDAQRSASEERVLRADDDDDDDEPPLPPPPSPLPMITPPQTKKDVDELDVQHLRRLDEETEALRFLQVKYDTLGKVKVEKPPTSTSQQPLVKTSGAGETVRLVGPQCRLNCDCSLTSAGDERPRMALEPTSLRQSLTQHSVTDRRRPPPPPLTARSQCSCPTSESRAGLQVSVDDHRLHHHHQHLHHYHYYHHHHHHQDQQQHRQPLEQFAHHQRCSQTSASVVRQQPHHHEGSDGGHHSSLVCSCHGDQLERSGGSGVITTRRQCSSMLSNAELFQIDLFYRSRKTLVYVCPCPAVLYFARAAGSNGGKSSSWRSAAAGVPVIVLDTVRIVVGPRLHVVLAERGTGFELWRYGLTDMEQYSVDETSTTGSDAAFHTVILPSGDAAGLCFDDAGSAAEFYRQLLKLDELYSISGGCSRTRKGKKTTMTSAGARDIIARYLIASRRL